MTLTPMMKMYFMYHKDVEIPQSKFYVYIHRNPLNDLIFYVGSARGNRLRAFDFKKHRNRQWTEEVISFGGFVNIKIEIIQSFKTAKEAQEFEYELMNRLRKTGQAYCCFEHD